MACGAVINAVWDLWARIEGKPLWEMVVVSTATIFSASASVAPQRTLASTGHGAGAAGGADRFQAHLRGSV
jgi:L-alanine-DL-glutamate epimerase-like enolase superfamily enzyme